MRFPKTFSFASTHRAALRKMLGELYHTGSLAWGDPPDKKKGVSPDSGVFRAGLTPTDASGAGLYFVTGTETCVIII